MGKKARTKHRQNSRNNRRKKVRNWRNDAPRAHHGKRRNKPHRRTYGGHTFERGGNKTRAAAKENPRGGGNPHKRASCN